MLLPYRDARLQRRRWLIGGGMIVLLGALLCALPLGDSLARLSYDLPFLFRGSMLATDVVVVLEDRPSLDAVGQKTFPPSRTVHARLVDRLREGEAKVIVFDILFRVPKPEEDAVLAAAIRRHGKVVLGSALDISTHQTGGAAGAHLAQVTPPPEVLRTNAAGVGLLLAGNLDAAFGVRRLLTAWRGRETIAVTAAKQYGTGMDRTERWINFHGAPPSVDTVTLGEVLGLDDRKLAPDFFRGKIVFIGFDPSVTPATGERDLFATPFTRFGHNYAPGVEVLANSCANLLNGDSLRRLGTGWQALLSGLLGAGFVVALLRVGRRWLLPVAGGLLVVLMLASIWVQWRQLLWWNWLVPAVVQLPLAVLLAYLCPRLKRVAFISYRRDGGSAFAVMIMEGLRVRGHDVFLDVKDLRPGDWWQQLAGAIQSTPNFILVLTPGMFPSSQEEPPPPANLDPLSAASRKEDWVRKEILLALSSGRNIIPVMPEGFLYPPDLATELKPLMRLQAVLHIHTNPDETFERLEEFLRHRKPSAKDGPRTA